MIEPRYRHRALVLAITVLCSANGLCFLDAQTSPNPVVQQTDTGLTLVIFDPGGAVIPTVRIEVKDSSGKVVNGQTNPFGRLNVSNLEPGICDVTVNMHGFETYTTKVAVTQGMMQEIAVTLVLAKNTITDGVPGVPMYVPTNSSSLVSELLPENAPVKSPMSRPTDIPRKESQTAARPSALKRALHKLGL